MSSTGGYENALPQVQQYMDRYQRVLDAVRVSHRGKPKSEVLEVLTAAFEAEGIEVWREVAEDAARLISEGSEGICGASDG